MTGQSLPLKIIVYSLFRVLTVLQLHCNCWGIQKRVDAATLPYLHEARNQISDSFRTFPRTYARRVTGQRCDLCAWMRFCGCTHFRAPSASQGSTEMRVRVSSVLIVLLLLFHRLLHGAFLHSALLFHRLLHRLSHVFKQNLWTKAYFLIQLRKR